MQKGFTSWRWTNPRGIHILPNTPTQLWEITPKQPFCATRACLTKKPVDCLWPVATYSHKKNPKVAFLPKIMHSPNNRHQASKKYILQSRSLGCGKWLSYDHHWLMAFIISCLTLGFFTKFWKERPEIGFFRAQIMIQKRMGISGLGLFV